MDPIDFKPLGAIGVRHGTAIIFGFLFLTTYSAGLALSLHNGQKERCSSCTHWMAYPGKLPENLATIYVCFYKTVKNYSGTSSLKTCTCV